MFIPIIYAYINLGDNFSYVLILWNFKHLTVWRRIFIEKLRVAQLVNKVWAFYGTWMSTVAFMKTSWIQCTLLYRFFNRLILPPHKHLCPRSNSFRSGFRTNFALTFPVSRILRISHSPWSELPNNIWSVQILTTNYGAKLESEANTLYFCWVTSSCQSRDIVSKNKTHSTDLQGCGLCSFRVVSHFIINRPKTQYLNVLLRHKMRKENKTDFTGLVPETIFNILHKFVSLHCVSCTSSYSNKNKNRTKAFVRPLYSTLQIWNKNQTRAKRLKKRTHVPTNSGARKLCLLSHAARPNFVSWLGIF